MDSRYSPRTSQQPDVRPISFLLSDDGAIAQSLMLPIRPEELTRTDPARVTVHQTLGRVASGWVDHFGRGLPTVTISGTTGWHYQPSTGMDGFQSFEALHALVNESYPKAIQAAIDAGRDPAGVQLIFVDLLDNFSFPVVLTNFVLRRSKSRPLLFQYNISMQATALTVDLPSSTPPSFGAVPDGLASLGGVIEDINSFLDDIDGLIEQATSFATDVIGPLADNVKKFTGTFNAVLQRIDETARRAGNLIDGPTNQLIGIAADLATVGLNVTRTISSIANIPSSIKADLARVTSAYNEVICLFSNSLRPRELYDDYDDLFGASNCSSTTGGRLPSQYESKDVFTEIYAGVGDQISISSDAAQSMQSIKQSDPVLSPLLLPEVGRLLGNINDGVWI